MKAFLYIDFEYHSSNNKNPELVCCSWMVGGKTTSMWLYKDSNKYHELANILNDYVKQGYHFVSFAYTAEARSMLALGMNVKKIAAIDLYLLYRQMSNHWDEVEYGKHLVEGKVKFLLKPKKKEYGKTVEGPKVDGTRMSHSLSSALYKFLQIQIDTDHKDAMRDLIIAGGPFSEADKTSIMKYCESDVAHLPKLFETMWGKWLGYCKRAESRSGSAFEEELFQDSLRMADYAAATAEMEQLGYPLDVEAARRLTRAIPEVLRSTCADVNEVLKDVIPFPPFVWNKKERKFSRQEKVLQEYIKEKYGEEWKVWTDGGAEGKNKQPSLSEDALSAMGASRHDFKPILVDQLARVVKLNQDLNGFKPTSGLQEVGTKKKKNFWDSVGDDGRVRPYFGIYGAQSSRSQPSATGFIFLKSAMFRGLVAPKQGKVIIACDYGQQEFLVGALLSGDKKMLEAYKSGDPYVYFAKEAKAIPPEGNKKTHPEIRDRFKSSVLGMQYGMGQVGLGSKITADTGVYTTPEEAKKIIDQFNSTFSVFAEWKRNLIREYDTAQREGTPYTIKLPCGWRMCGDNNNMLSVANVPIQGFGASAMRFSVIKAMEDGLDVIQTLHDALYAEADVETWEEDLDKLLSAMAYGFERALSCQYGGKLPSFAVACRNDPCAWGPDLVNGESVTPSGIKVKTQTQYADPRILTKDGSYKESVKAMVNTAWPEGGEDLEGLDL